MISNLLFTKYHDGCEMFYDSFCLMYLDKELTLIPSREIFRLGKLSKSKNFYIKVIRYNGNSR